MGGAIGGFFEDAWDTVEDVAENAWDVVEEVGAEIFSWIGLESRTEIVTDITVSSLLTPGVADKAARTASIRSSQGDLKTYGESYKAFQRSYKNRYSKRFLENLGYSPTSTATTRVLAPAAVLTYIQSTDPLATNILGSSIRYITVDEAAWDWMEDNIGWSNENQVATVGGSEFEVLITDNGTTIDMDLSQDYTISIVEYLTANYIYDGINDTVEIDSLLYDVPAFDGTDQGGYYRTTVLQQVDGTTEVDIDTPIPTHSYNIPGTVDDNQKMVIRYDRGGTEWYYYTEDSENVPSNLYTEADIDVTAIIAMKENNVVQDLEDRKLKRALDKLGLVSDSFVDTLSNPDLDSAYIMTGLPADTQTTAGKATIFKMFDLIMEGSGDLSISIDQLNMTYSFTLDKTAVNDKIMEVGEYSNELQVASQGSTTFYRRILRHQATETQYRELTIDNFLLTYQISGQQIEVGFGSGSEDLRLVLPINQFNSLKYRDWVDVYEQSLCMVSYTYEEVRLKWYESPAFAFIMKVVAIVITIVSIIAAIPSGGTSLQGAAAFWAVVQTIAIAVAVSVAVDFALGFIMEFLVDQLGMDPALAGAIGAIIIALAASYGFNYNMGAEQWLQLASMTVDNISTMYADQAQAIKDMDAEHLKNFMEDNEAIIEKLESMRSTDSNNMNIAYDPIGGLSERAKVSASINTEAMCSVDDLFNIDYQINKRIRVREVA